MRIAQLCSKSERTKKIQTKECCFVNLITFLKVRKFQKQILYFLNNEQNSLT